MSRLDASVGPMVGTMGRKMYDVVEAALLPAAGGAGAQARVQQQAVAQLPRCGAGGWGGSVGGPAVEAIQQYKKQYKKQNTRQDKRH